MADRARSADAVRRGPLGRAGQLARRRQPVRVTYRLMVAVNIKYGTAVVFSHNYQTTETMQLLVPKDKFESGTFNPATDPLGKDPHALLVDQEPLGKAGHVPGDARARKRSAADGYRRARRAQARHPPARVLRRGRPPLHARRRRDPGVPGRY